MFFMIGGPKKYGKSQRGLQLHGEIFRSQREIFLSLRKNYGHFEPKKRREPTIGGLSPLRYTNIQYFPEKSKSL